ncbi:hypothetical protein PSTG_05319 [Puccinia striiformis f. sp. tritici PST-78]|uniref:Uncharacterized protein n=1 Tax=Puccinia striiformis f. sp. tritici PST-78 TaxID=1165861 RepID=A0A0L0VQJ0_9BASI|nr:hypothetical protein PSTG_05319 [Puccinia striiformis f. sp. tritici PST-78]
MVQTGGGMEKLGAVAHQSPECGLDEHCAVLNYLSLAQWSQTKHGSSPYVGVDCYFAVTQRYNVHSSPLCPPWLHKEQCLPVLSLIPPPNQSQSTVSNHSITRAEIVKFKLQNKLITMYCRYFAVFLILQMANAAPISPSETAPKAPAGRPDPCHNPLMCTRR